MRVGLETIPHPGSMSGLWVAGNEGMEKNRKLLRYIGTTTLPQGSTPSFLANPSHVSSSMISASGLVIMKHEGDTQAPSVIPEEKD